MEQAPLSSSPFCIVIAALHHSPGHRDFVVTSYRTHVLAVWAERRFECAYQSLRLLTPEAPSRHETADSKLKSETADRLLLLPKFPKTCPEKTKFSGSQQKRYSLRLVFFPHIRFTAKSGAPVGSRRCWRGSRSSRLPAAPCVPMRFGVPMNNSSGDLGSSHLV